MADPEAEPAGETTAPLRVIDLFAGCGGLTRGFVESKFFEPIAAVELNEQAAATYAANFGPHVFNGDIGKWIESDLPDADVVIGGPPCQGFSNLGKKLADDERNKLWRLYVKALVKIRPKAFLIENVDRFATSEEFSALQRETSPGGSLEHYELSPRMVNAADYGAAQVRKRFIVIGTRRDLQDVEKIEVPDGTVPRAEWRTVKEALVDVPASIPADRTRLPDRSRNGIPGPFTSEELHLTRYYDPKISIPRFKAIPAGGNRFNLPEHLKAPCWVKHSSGSGDVMGRLRWDRPSVTIRTEFFKPEKGRYLHPDEHRALSHYEAALLQGFPLDFQWCGSKVQIARQIGNAVPVELARELATHIGKILTGDADGSARARQPQHAQPQLPFVRVPKSG